jgi:DNA mismatch repair protein MutS2
MTTQLYNNPFVLELIEWPLIQQEIQQFAHFDYTTKERLLTLKSHEEISYFHEKTGLLLDHLTDDKLVDLHRDFTKLNSDERLKQIIKRLKKSAIVQLDELNEIAILCESIFDHSDFLNTISLLHTNFEALRQNRKMIHDGFLREFRTFVNIAGEADFSKHPLLKKINSEILSLEDSIRKQINNLKMNEFKQSLQYDGHDIIHDRFVLPVKTDHYNTGLGQIISRSESGNTLYIEPFAIRDKNYRRLELVISLEKELELIFIRFSNFLTTVLPTISEFSDSIFLLDQMYAAASYAHLKSLTKPEFVEDFTLELRGMFHPLIKNPVKNDLKLDSLTQGLVISGPNTGGKTAALKTIALCILFAKHGLFIPAKEAKIHLYDEVFYFGNDGQNITEGLSSFSSEVVNYTKLFENLKNSNLIIIDEIFNSTSSEEASALAIALFDEILKFHQAHILVSTHHQMLKTFIHQKSNFISAHVGFDPVLNIPTYKLIYGLPGSSLALKIFANLTNDNSISKSIFDNAIKILDKKMINYESLLNEVAKKNSELDKLILETEEIKKQLKNQKMAMEGIYNLKLIDKIKDAENEISRILNEARIYATSAKTNPISSKKIEEKDSKLTKELKILLPDEQNDNNANDLYSHLKSPHSFEINKDYFSVFLKQNIRLKSFNIKKDEAIVAKGTMTIKCPLSSLRVNQNLSSKHTVNISYSPTLESKIEYDCRGMRLEEFESLIEHAISDLTLGRVPFINIIHGHGHGVLKNWLRNYVKTNKSIQIEQSESGNDGETKIFIT